jgi:hypothetical protein
MQKRMSLSRRSLLAASATGAVVAAASAAEAASFGNPDEPPEGAVNVVNPKALTDPGPQDPNLASNEPAFLNPPPTDVNGMPQYWASFNLAPKRIQNGGWARQLTQDDFKISTTIAAVNMRLGPGGVRELHWLTNRMQETAVAQGFLRCSRESFTVSFTHRRHILFCRWAAIGPLLALGQSANVPIRVSRDGALHVAATEYCWA